MMLGTNSDIPASIMGLVSTYLASFFLFCKLPFKWYLAIVFFSSPEQELSRRSAFVFIGTHGGKIKTKSRALEETVGRSVGLVDRSVGRSVDRF